MTLYIYAHRGRRCRRRSAVKRLLRAGIVCGAKESYLYA